jgi:prevent-host-death family protein
MSWWPGDIDLLTTLILARVASFEVVHAGEWSAEDCDSTYRATFDRMDRIGVRELRQHASRYLERVKRGETVEVTERGRLVALLVPPAPSIAARDVLIGRGQLWPGTHPFTVPAKRVAAGGPTAAALDELRAERL